MASVLTASAPLPPGAWPLRGEGLTLALGAAAAILHLEGPRGAAPADVPAAGRCIARSGGVMLSTGPQTCLWVGASPAPAGLQDPFAAVVDMSSAWTHLAVEGRDAIPLLRKGCALDLHPRRFPAGSCAATGFARLRAILWRADPAPRYDMLVARSHALGLWEWLAEAAAEFGCVAHNSTGA